mgnify:CR=1
MTKVLIISTSRKTRGGITAVLKAHEKGEQWEKFHCHWVQTHRDGNNIRKLAYLALAWLDFLMRVPFYDIVHVHFSLATTARRKVPFVKVAKALGKKVIIHLHCGSQIHDIWNKNYDYLFSVADVSLLLSENLLHMVEEHTGKGRDYRVCYNPCPQISKEPVLQKKKQILFSGTLYAGKGYQDLICAFAKIAKQYSDWKIVLAGNGEVEKGKALSAELGIANQVEFLGWVSGEDKDNVFRESMIFCLPSYAEGFPMAVLDAWAYGLPVVTTPVGGILDVAKDGENMLLFNPGNIEALAKQLDKMITDEGLRNRIALASLDFAEHKFNPNTINNQLGELYEELSNQLNK